MAFTQQTLVGNVMDLVGIGIGSQTSIGYAWVTMVDAITGVPVVLLNDPGAGTYLGPDVDLPIAADGSYSIVLPDSAAAGVRYVIHVRYAPGREHATSDWQTYISEPINLAAPPAVTMTFIGETHLTGTQTAIPFPAGTESGDVFVLAMTAYDRFSGPSSSDPRVIAASPGVIAAVPHDFNETGIWAGYGRATASTAPLAINLNSGFLDDAVAILTVFRLSGPFSVATVLNPEADSSSGAYSPVMPGGDCGVTCLMARTGGGISAGFTGDTTGRWTQAAAQGSRITEEGIYYSPTGTPPGVWGGLSGSSDWVGYTVGFSGA